MRDFLFVVRRALLLLVRWIEKRYGWGRDLEELLSAIGALPDREAVRTRLQRWLRENDAGEL